MDAHRLPHAYRLPHACATSFLAHCICAAACTIFAAQAEVATAEDISAIMAGLETDAMGTAEQLLALSPEVDRDPQTIHAFVNAARTVGRKGDWKKSIALLARARQAHQTRLADASPPGNDSDDFVYTMDLAIASASMQCDEFERAIQHCQSVIAAPQAPAPHRSAAFPILVKAYRCQAMFDEASQSLHQAATDAHGRLAAVPLAELALAIGTDCLQQKKAAAAQLAYDDYLTLAPEGPRVADAKLGAAWAAALGAESSDAAATRLQAFVDEYPDHRDAPHALRASAACLDQADQAEQAEAVRGRLLESYPQSDAATAVLARYTASQTAWTESVRAAWRTRMEASADDRPSIAPEEAAAVFAESLRSSDDALWQAALQWLVNTDSDGSHTDAILTRFTTGGQEPLAEHLAVDLIALAGDGPEPQSPAASEAACRWAGASERWSMLALTADELGPPSQRSHRSPAIDRLLAESLIQTQRPAESLRWWDWLIDECDADDFATLLRAAETTVAHGKTEAASTRIERAKAAAGEDAFHLALVQILTAELSIRRARFDEARETLSEVVSRSDSAPALRPRAQWMIGETYFLQQRFAEAIDAYRRVDAMDAAGEWAPAALLQAGKAFEKLGRGRDAAVCYTALLTRFRDWPHANFAQSRLATLSPTTSAPASVLR